MEQDVALVVLEHLSHKLHVHVLDIDLLSEDNQPLGQGEIIFCHGAPADSC
jgi:hypothetical protein